MPLGILLLLLVGGVVAQGPLARTLERRDRAATLNNGCGLDKVAVVDQAGDVVCSECSPPRQTACPPDTPVLRIEACPAPGVCVPVAAADPDHLQCPCGADGRCVADQTRTVDSFTEPRGRVQSDLRASIAAIALAAIIVVAGHAVWTRWRARQQQDTG